MTIAEAEAECTRLLKTKKHTSEEVWEAYLKLCEAMDKLRMERNNICDNDEQWGDLWP